MATRGPERDFIKTESYKGDYLSKSGKSTERAKQLAREVQAEMNEVLRNGERERLLLYKNVFEEKIASPGTFNLSMTPVGPGEGKLGLLNFLKMKDDVVGLALEEYPDLALVAYSSLMKGMGDANLLQEGDMVTMKAGRVIVRRNGKKEIDTQLFPWDMLDKVNAKLAQLDGKKDEKPKPEPKPEPAPATPEPTPAPPATPEAIDFDEDDAALDVEFEELRPLPDHGELEAAPAAAAQVVGGRGAVPGANGIPVDKYPATPAPEPKPAPKPAPEQVEQAKRVATLKEQFGIGKLEEIYLTNKVDILGLKAPFIVSDDRAQFSEYSVDYDQSGLVSLRMDGQIQFRVNQPRYGFQRNIVVPFDPLVITEGSTSDDVKEMLKAAVKTQVDAYMADYEAMVDKHIQLLGQPAGRRGFEYKETAYRPLVADESTWEMDGEKHQVFFKGELVVASLREDGAKIRRGERTKEIKNQELAQLFHYLHKGGEAPGRFGMNLKHFELRKVEDAPAPEAQIRRTVEKDTEFINEHDFTDEITKKIRAKYGDVLLDTDSILNREKSVYIQEIDTRTFDPDTEATNPTGSYQLELYYNIPFKEGASFKNNPQEIKLSFHLLAGIPSHEEIMDKIMEHIGYNYFVPVEKDPNGHKGLPEGGYEYLGESYKLAGEKIIMNGEEKSLTYNGNVIRIMSHNLESVNMEYDVEGGTKHPNIPALEFVKLLRHLDKGDVEGSIDVRRVFPDGLEAFALIDYSEASPETSTGLEGAMMDRFTEAQIRRMKRFAEQNGYPLSQFTEPKTADEMVAGLNLSDYAQLSRAQNVRGHEENNAEFFVSNENPDCFLVLMDEDVRAKIYHFKNDSDGKYEKTIQVDLLPKGGSTIEKPRPFNEVDEKAELTPRQKKAREALNGDYIRDAEEMRRLASRNAWTGVEAGYQRLLALEEKGMELASEDHVLGARAALQLGDLYAQKTRLKRAIAVEGADVDQAYKVQLDTLESEFNTVQIDAAMLKRDLRLKPVQTPFAPLKRKGIESVQSKFIEGDKSLAKGFLLPKGVYQFKDATESTTLLEFTIGDDGIVIENEDLKQGPEKMSKRKVQQSVESIMTNYRSNPLQAIETWNEFPPGTQFEGDKEALYKAVFEAADAEGDQGLYLEMAQLLLPANENERMPADLFAKLSRSPAPLTGVVQVRFNAEKKHRESWKTLTDKLNAIDVNDTDMGAFNNIYGDGQELLENLIGEEKERMEERVAAKAVEAFLAGSPIPEAVIESSYIGEIDVIANARYQNLSMHFYAQQGNLVKANAHADSFLQHGGDGWPYKEQEVALGIQKLAAKAGGLEIKEDGSFSWEGKNYTTDFDMSNPGHADMNDVKLSIVGAIETGQKSFYAFEESTYSAEGEKDEKNFYSVRLEKSE